MSKTSVDAIIDKFGRVYLPLMSVSNGQKKIKGISFTNQKQDVQRVVSTEPRYEGSAIKYLACELEER